VADVIEEQYSIRGPRNQTEKDREYSQRMQSYFSKSIGTNVDRLRNFTKFVPRQSLSLFLAKNELFQHILKIHGHIIECGVHLGGGFTTWGQLSAIYEPYNHIRRIVGFDTFTGFVKIDDKDKADAPDFVVEGGLETNAENDLRECINLYDLNRPIGHIPRLELVVGDALETIPKYIKENKHLVVAMLYLDFDLYKPTKVAIENFLPRMPKGSIIVFDELNQPSWPGETQALMETIGIRNVGIKRFPYIPQLSYAVLE